MVVILVWKTPDGEVRPVMNSRGEARIFEEEDVPPAFIIEGQAVELADIGQVNRHYTLPAEVAGSLLDVRVAEKAGP